MLVMVPDETASTEDRRLRVWIDDGPYSVFRRSTSLNYVLFLISPEALMFNLHSCMAYEIMRPSEAVRSSTREQYKIGRHWTKRRTGDCTTALAYTPFTRRKRH